MKVLVIGLDGATWDLIKPWAEEGALPTFKKLMEEGTWGKLESTIPPITGPAWISFATGKKPEKHGIFDFYIPKGSLERLVPISPRDVKCKTLPELITDSIFINLPASAPPKSRDVGIIIADFLVRSENYVFPEELKKKYPILEEYRITPNESLKTDPIKYAKDIRDVERKRFECAKQLFLNENWKLFFVLFSGTDWIQHIYYHKLVGKKFHEIPLEIRGIYEDIDGYLRWFIENMPKLDNEWVIILMSDHGFKVFNKFFRVNSWLNKKGLLKITYGKEKEIAWAKTREKELRSFKTLRVPRKLIKIMRKILPQRIQTFILQSLRKYLKVNLGSSVKIDNKNSIALCPISIMTNFGYIYINDDRFDKVVSLDEREKVISVLKRELSSLDIIKNVWEIRHHPDSPIPDLIIETIEEYGVNPRVTSDNIIDDILENPASHDLYGIFLAYGSRIKKGHKIKGAKIYDIAPTLLHIFGLPIPNDMDGRVLMEIFEEDSEFAKREPKYVDPSYYEKRQEDEKLKKAIRNLKLKGRI
ncbi:alkaline phosphatase family protein [Pyrococcus kukulkanii]|uniref:alkaline phosphatase family protein n=1 Tax=Pyrococcus kukulkanii TaxID=1609559 RepID=UPI0035613174